MSVVGDSLAAVKKLVFDDKVLTIDELKNHYSNAKGRTKTYQ
jgi:hypothetical protein